MLFIEVRVNLAPVVSRIYIYIFFFLLALAATVCSCLVTHWKWNFSSHSGTQRTCMSHIVTVMATQQMPCGQIFTKHTKSSLCSELKSEEMLHLSMRFQLWSLHFSCTDVSLKVMLLFWISIWPLAFPDTTCPRIEAWLYWSSQCVHQSMKASHRGKVKKACLLCIAMIQVAIKRVWYAALGLLLVSQSVCECPQLRRAEGSVSGLSKNLGK